MPWQDRLKEAAYTSPSGTRIKFYYEDLQKKFSKKTTAFDFNGAAFTHVQDNGSTGNRYPIRVIFWGNDCDLEADTFETLLRETGVGKLEHPMDGTKNVIPFGEITRNDRLKTEANQVTIELELWQTSLEVYPSQQSSPAHDVTIAVDAFNTAAAEQFSTATPLNSTVEAIRYKTSFLAVLNSAHSTLNDPLLVGSLTETNNIYTSILQDIDNLLGTPLTLLSQTIKFYQSAVGEVEDINSVLQIFDALFNDNLSFTAAPPGYGNTQNNEFVVRDFSAMSVLSTMVLAVVNTKFKTKAEALETAYALLLRFDSLNAWRETNMATLEVVDTGEAYQGLQSALATAAGYLVYISFTLAQERRIFLDRARTIIDLVAELYGAVDENLDFFIQSNNLNGDEILELPYGREVVYYV